MEVKHQEVQEYYGKELQSSEDLKTNACCPIQAPPKYIQEILRLVHDEVKDKYYGCGLTIPNDIHGLDILDLGSGSGRDCFIASKLVGEKGSVTGIDMTDEQLAVANKHINFHTEQFGFNYPNVKFIKGNIDSIDTLGLEAESFDVIISNCVINLAMNKQKVLTDAFRLLKPGGEMYFSDVYADRRVSEELQKDPVLWGECLSGALYWNDFLNYAKNAGFTDPRVIESHPISIENEDLEKIVGDHKFYSVTYRLFKIEGLEMDCEDYGQAVAYKGTIDGKPSSFDLDNHHNFPKGKVVSVCGNSYKMLKDTRFDQHFDFYGSWDTHFGIFEGCGGNMPFNSTKTSDDGAACC